MTGAEFPRLHEIRPGAEARYYSSAPEVCPKCSGSIRDYNAQTAIPNPGVSLTYSPSLIVHLFICGRCSYKLFAPPAKPPGR